MDRQMNFPFDHKGCRNTLTLSSCVKDLKIQMNFLQLYMNKSKVKAPSWSTNFNSSGWSLGDTGIYLIRSPLFWNNLSVIRVVISLPSFKAFLKKTFLPNCTGLFAVKPLVTQFWKVLQNKLYCYIVASLCISNRLLFLLVLKVFPLRHFEKCVWTLVIQSSL